jgi:hypothetical protein
MACPPVSVSTPHALAQVKKNCGCFWMDFVMMDLFTELYWLTATLKMSCVPRSLIGGLFGRRHTHITNLRSACCYDQYIYFLLGPQNFAVVCSVLSPGSLSVPGASWPLPIGSSHAVALCQNQLCRDGCKCIKALGILHP